MYASRFVWRMALLAVFSASIVSNSDLLGVAKAAAGEADLAPVPQACPAMAADVPRELAMRPLSAYRVEPPDILGIYLIKPKAAGAAGPQSLDRANQGEMLGAAGTSPESGKATKGGTHTSATAGANTSSGATADNTGVLTLSFDNRVNDAATAMQWLSRAVAKTPSKPKPVSTPNVPTTRVGPDQPIAGQYLVAPAGTINLRHYGAVQVMSMTLPEVKTAVEKQLSKHLESPEVAVEVLAYNSKVYYVITEGAGLGDNVRRVPITGNDTVLDAISMVNGLSQVSSKRMWIARPSLSNPLKGITLMVDYAAITQRAATATNYQLLPGDRLFIAEDRTMAVNNWLSKTTMPAERVMGLISLGASTIENVQKLMPEPAHP
jgi:polysaccharide biosynthesis/export protein